MPQHTKLLNFKATPGQVDAWKEVAHLNKRTLSRWIRDTLDAAVNGIALPPVPAAADNPAPLLKKAEAVADQLLERARSVVKAGPCERRLPKGAFCKSCGRIHGK